MRIAFFVNDLASEFPNYATTMLAWQARQRGHEVFYVTPDDWLLDADESLQAHMRAVPKGKSIDHREFFKVLRGPETKQIKTDMSGIDVLLLRNDPANDAQERPWAAESGILFGREAVKRRVIVLNDPDSLGRATNKLYFQSFPAEARAETIITRNGDDIKAFATRARSSSSRSRDRADRECSRLTEATPPTLIR